MHVLVVSARPVVAGARATARSASRWATIHVLDADGAYRPVADEHVLRPIDVGLEPDTLHRLAAAHGVQRLTEILLPRAARHLLLGGVPAGEVPAGEGEVPAGDVLLAVHPGVLLLSDPSPLAAEVPPGAFAAALRAPDRDTDGRRPDAADLRASGAANPHVIALTRRSAAPVLTAWDAAARADDPRWLDAALLDHPDARVLRRPELVLGAAGLTPGQTVTTGPGGTLLLDGASVVALDLTGLDPRRPWWWGDDSEVDVRGRLSEHPALAALVADVADQARADDEAAAPPSDDLATTSLGVPLDEPLRLVYAGDDGTAPDPFAPAAAADLLAWLVEPTDTGGPGRYLRALLSSRPDLRSAFPGVPGADEPGFRRWLERHAAAEGYPAQLMGPALRAPWPAAPPTRRPGPGVEVIGFLDGELGIGESARLVVQALEAAGIPHAEHPLSRFLTSPRRAASPTAATRPLRTAVLCVNADLTPQVATSIPHLLARRYRIGMWYWEVEEFPSSQHGGFSAVDEVWVATDFMRRAIAPHSPVPVVTMTPPLPQRAPGPVPSRDELGLPGGPLLLFSFDHLSTLERKNPLGLIEAFSRAFTPGEGPTLVIKSINARRRPSDAERVRLAAATRSDVLVVERYLEPAERDGLVAACDGYVSLHRSEGLGLTMAEAMAWGKPVVATGYGGNLQFMTDDNSVLVPWTAVPIGPGAAPYPPGGTWAEPDLDAAAAALRSLVERPDEARARGERAAADIAALHSPQVAGRAIAARLAQITPARRLRVVGMSRVRGAARATLRRLR